MNTINPKEQVAQAINQQWPAFAEAHPRLAEAIDQTLAVESATTSLADDPEYQAAMVAAGELGAGADAVIDTVKRLVSQWLRQLV